jgi:hypothetical protein
MIPLKGLSATAAGAMACSFLTDREFPMQSKHATLKTNAGFPQRRPEIVWMAALAVAAGGAWAWAWHGGGEFGERPTVGGSGANVDDSTADNAKRMLDEGRETFRFDTFGSEAFWGDKLHLHQALVRQDKGGVGEGLTARQALGLGLKVDVDKLPTAVSDAIRDGKVDLDSADTTYTLLKAGAVIGVKASFGAQDRISSMGITCALCHSTVDDAFAPGIGRRLDGWPNRDLDVGKVIALAPELKPLTDRLGVIEADLKTVLLSWGPGKYDAEIMHDGKATRPDGKSAATLLPAAKGNRGCR